MNVFVAVDMRVQVTLTRSRNLSYECFVYYFPGELKWFIEALC